MIDRGLEVVPSCPDVGLRGHPVDDGNERHDHENRDHPRPSDASTRMGFDDLSIRIRETCRRPGLGQRLQREAKRQHVCLTTLLTISGGLRLVGFLENTRLISVKAGSRAELRTRLTSSRPQKAASRAALRIVVLEGEGAVNIIQQKTATAPVVEVRDQNDLPASGATVRFAIRGGRATFSMCRWMGAGS